jgi:excisionase family DNA binding protein
MAHAFIATVSPRYLDVAGAATYLGVKERQIRSLVYRREIPFTKVGRLVRFDIQELDAWLKVNTVPMGGNS